MMFTVEPVIKGPFWETPWILHSPRGMLVPVSEHPINIKAVKNKIKKSFILVFSLNSWF
jgi:hypothetical protein